ncbi:MAG: hypothetical protein ACYCOR_21265 [Acidobacteriaceae bacterium]
MRTEDFIRLIDLLLEAMPITNNVHCQTLLFHMARQGELHPQIFEALHTSWADRDWINWRERRKGTVAYRQAHPES